MSAIHPDVDLQASLLAQKVLRGVISLSAAVEELDEWQSDTVEDPEARVASRSLIVTHALNTLIRRETAAEEPQPASKAAPRKPARANTLVEPGTKALPKPETKTKTKAGPKTATKRMTKKASNRR